MIDKLESNRILLPLGLMVGAAGGFAVGGLWGAEIGSGAAPIAGGFIRLLGDLFLNTLKMVVVPLVVCSMIVGVCALGRQKKIGKTFGVILTYYFSTTIIAVFTGIALVSAIKPGVGSVAKAAATGAKRLTWYEAIYDMVAGLLPSNLFAAAANGEILGLLVVSIIFGFLLNSAGERSKLLLDPIELLNDLLMKFVRIIVWFAPVGVFGIVAWRVSDAGGGAAVYSEISIVAKYFITVLIGLFFHGLVVLPLLLKIFGGRSPRRYVAHFSDALLTAFSTASSAGTLPITIRAAEGKAKISEVASRSVLPLGATINMDGTALYEAVAAIFIAQSYGIDLSGMQIVIISLTATLAAIGAAAIPEAGLVTMAMVLISVNVPVEGIGLLLSVDWLLDRFRTTLNVWGDAVGAAVVDNQYPRFS